MKTLRYFLTLMGIITVLFLVACSDGKTEESKTDTSSNEETNNKEEPESNLMPISEAFEKHKVWYNAETYEEGLTRDSDISEVYVFENGKVKTYTTREVDLTIEDTIDKSDDEFIEYVKELTEEKFEELYQEEKEFEKEVQKEEAELGRDYEIDKESYEKYEENIKYIFEDPIEYSLDIRLDGQGMDAEREAVILDIREEEREERYSNGTDVTPPELSAFPINETIFEQDFSGMEGYEIMRSLVTKVDDVSFFFELDNLDTEKENVTVEEELEE